MLAQQNAEAENVVARQFGEFVEDVHIIKVEAPERLA
jgi:hypothetical protein|tara:strand:+ start:1072 stop:1182 length:111 start_codon:yes stop_codon:yes gene_type:complete